MSIRRRILILVLALNLGVLGVILIASSAVTERWRSEHRQIYQDYFAGVLRDAYAPEKRSPVSSLRTLLGLDTFRTVFRDVLVTNGRTPSAPGFVDLNPMGAAHRDHEHFPLQAVRDGIRRAMDERELVQVGDGYCVPIESGEQVVAGAWFRPFLLPPPRLPASVLVVAMLAGAVLVAAFARWLVERSVVRPLRALGDAAGRVGAGDYAVRVPSPGAGHELDALVAAFNSMAARVAGHTEELDRAVRAATEEAARRERALVLSGRLAAMGTLAAGIAHEINNPIGGMTNAVRRLAAAPDLVDRDRRYLELVQDGLERVARIARKVLDFSPKQVEARQFELRQAVDAARGLVEHRLRQGDVELACDLPDDLPSLWGDPHEIQQVLLNVLINALDVLEGHPPPRRIELRARRQPGPGGAADPAGIEIVIRDNGPGLPREELGRVFDPFFTAKGRPDATGLGLFITYSIVRNHGGDIEVDAAPGQGFTVTIRLPPAPEAEVGR